MIGTVDEYAAAVLSGETTEVRGLYGRLLRGRAGRPEDFDCLGYDTDRDIVMLMGPDGLRLLLGKSGYEMLIALGATPAHIRRHIEEGSNYKLAVFAAQGLLPATWEGATSMVCRVYPELAVAMRCYAKDLRLTSFAEIQEASGFSYHEVDVAGPDDPRFMTLARFRHLPSPTLSDVRAFLYFTVRLRELFTGDGYTVDNDGNRGVREYFAHNVPLASLGRYALLDVDVQLPSV